MRHISLAKSAISVGGVLGIYHLLWTMLVATGLAKLVMDFVLRLHFIDLQYQIAPFDLGTAAALIALTFSVGAVIGLAFAFIWNWLGDRT